MPELPSVKLTPERDLAVVIEAAGTHPSHRCHQEHESVDGAIDAGCRNLQLIAARDDLREQSRRVRGPDPLLAGRHKGLEGHLSGGIFHGHFIAEGTICSRRATTEMCPARLARASRRAPPRQADRAIRPTVPSRCRRVEKDPAGDGVNCTGTARALASSTREARLKVTPDWTDLICLTRLCRCSALLPDRRFSRQDSVPPMFRSRSPPAEREMWAQIQSGEDRLAAGIDIGRGERIRDG